MEHKETLLSRVWSRILYLAGVRFEHQWTAQEYLEFLKKQGWRITHSREMAARITLIYAECVREEDEGKRDIKCMSITRRKPLS